MPSAGDDAESAGDETATDDPAGDETATDDPAGDETATDDPAGDETATDDPATSEIALPSELEPIQTALIEWYESDHREFPWRETTEPYPILVSEVMSQQTQLDRVVDAYEAFLEEWPTVEALAAADRGEVVAFWSDHALGYNNRARYLHEAANQILEEYDGEFPDRPAELQELMGVGPYTANAVASFAFNAGDAVVDTNVKRVLYRAFSVPDDDPTFERVADELLPDGESRRWNNAIMELGGVACGQTPRCDEAGCPWRRWCRAYETGDFTAPDVSEQPSFEGSRRQFRGRVIQTLSEYDELAFDELGPRVRVDYSPEGNYGREWLRELVSGLEDDGLVVVDDRNPEVDPDDEIGQDGEGIESAEPTVRLRR